MQLRSFGPLPWPVSRIGQGTWNLELGERRDAVGDAAHDQQGRAPLALRQRPEAADPRHRQGGRRLAERVQRLGGRGRQHVVDGGVDRGPVEGSLAGHDLEAPLAPDPGRRARLEVQVGDALGVEGGEPDPEAVVGHTVASAPGAPGLRGN